MDQPHWEAAEGEGLPLLAQGSAEWFHKKVMPLIAAWQSNQGSHPKRVAEGEGFEPSVGITPRSISSRVP